MKTEKGGGEGEAESQGKASEQETAAGKDYGVERVRFFWDYERSHLTTRLVIIFSAFVSIVTILNAQVASPVIHLSTSAEDGALLLVLVVVLVQVADVVFRLKRLTIKTDKLLGDLATGGLKQSLKEMCGIEYESTSAWDELRWISRRIKAVLAILTFLALLLLYLGLGGPT